MTFLSHPRVAFHSDDAISNVSTANNQNVVDILDYDNVRLKNPLNLSPEAYRDWLMELCDVRQNGAWRRTMFGYWNYYGDQLTTFGDATVTSVLLPGEPLPDDPLTRANVSLVARLVDLDPADTFTSQMFTSTFAVTSTDEKGQPITLIDGVEPTVASTRWINFKRPCGSGNFYCVVPLANLSFAPPGQSPALDRLREAVEAGGGLSLRYCFYDFVAPITSPEAVEEMREKFLRGEYVLNAKVGRVAGTFGAWDGSAPVSAPAGRWLYPLGNPYVRRRAHAAAEAEPAPEPAPLSHGAVDALWDAGPAGTDGSPAAASPEQPAGAAFTPPAFGFAAASVSPDGSLVTLDLGATFPEVSPTDMTKVDVGTVTLLAGGRPVAPVDYSREAYERLGGVAEVRVPDDLRQQVLSQPLSLTWENQGSSGVVVEQVEHPYVVAETQCTYLNLPHAAGDIEVRVFEPDGSPLARPIRLAVEQWRDYSTPSTTKPASPPKVHPPAFEFRQIQPGDPEWMVREWLDVPAGGRATLSLHAKVAGCYKVRFYPPHVRHENPNHNNAIALDYYCGVRVLPHDDYSSVPDSDVTWDLVWREVFLYYALMYPVMSQYVPWGPANAPLDPDRVHTLAAVLKELVDARNLGSSMYMPVTRELSEGKRDLVRRWCDLQLSEGAAAARGANVRGVGGERGAPPGERAAR